MARRPACAGRSWTAARGRRLRISIRVTIAVATAVAARMVRNQNRRFPSSRNSRGRRATPRRYRQVLTTARGRPAAPRPGPRAGPACDAPARSTARWTGTAGSGARPSGHTAPARPPPPSPALATRASQPSSDAIPRLSARAGPIPPAVAAASILRDRRPLRRGACPPPTNRGGAEGSSRDDTVQRTVPRRMQSTAGIRSGRGGPTDRHQPRPWRLDRDDAGRDFYAYPNAPSHAAQSSDPPADRSGLGETRTPTSSRTSAPKTDASAIPPRGPVGDPLTVIVGWIRRPDSRQVGGLPTLRLPIRPYTVKLAA